VCVVAVCVAVLGLTPVLERPADAATNALAFAVPSNPNGLLHVFIPGTQLSASQSTKFLEQSVSQGYHAIGVNYPNSRSVGGYCGTNDACFGQVRREIVYGNTDKYDSHFFDSSKVDVSPDNSIVGQLTQKLQAMPSNSSWAQYLSNGRVNWTKVVISGHSQGAGHAGILGIDQNVARVDLLAGPNDDIGNEKPPSWTKAAPTTPEARWFGLAHDKDKSRNKQLNSWNELFGFTDSTATGETPTGRHRLITTLAAPDDRYHESVVVDQYLNLQNSVPRLIPTWDSLLNGNLGSTTGSVAFPTINPYGGNFTDTTHGHVS
jgi:hypothetical protein